MQPEVLLATDPAEVELSLMNDTAWCVEALAALEAASWSSRELWVCRFPNAVVMRSEEGIERFFVHGDPAGVSAIVEAMPRRPRAVNLVLRPEVLPVFQKWYEFGPIDTMLRYSVTGTRFEPSARPAQGSGQVVPVLDDALTSSFRRSREGQGLGGGQWHGFLEDGELTTVAGTAALCAKHRIALLARTILPVGGSGRRSAAAVVSSLLANLFDELGCNRVVVDLHSGDAAAIDFYESVGFSEACTFIETVAVERAGRG